MLPVLEGALERAVALAASMDSRGYGRHGETPPAVRHTAAGLTLGGLVLVAIGAYGVLDPSVPFVLRAPALIAGGVALAGALMLSGRRSDRTRYRPDQWLVAEWVVAACGVVAVVGVVISGRAGGLLDPSVYPLEVPPAPDRRRRRRADRRPSRLGGAGAPGAVVDRHRCGRPELEVAA